MTTMTIEQALFAALQHHQAEQLAQAESLYRQILAHAPDHPDALHLLGLVFHRSGRASEAEGFIRRAIKAVPGQAQFHSNLGNVLQDLLRFEDAIAEYRTALSLEPNFPQALNNLGNALKSVGRIDEARDAFQRSIQINPNNPTAHNNLGNTFMALSQYENAAESYRAAITLSPQFADAHNNLGGALQALRRVDEAIGEHRTAAAINPSSASAYNNLAYALEQDRRLDEALVECLRALDLQPNHVNALQNLGNIYKDRGRVTEALDAYRRAMLVDPRNSAIHSRRLLLLHFSSDYDPASVLQEHRTWDAQFARPLSDSTPHKNDRSPGRKLRIGYVSADFRSHPVARILIPVFEAHNRDQFEIICFSDVAVEDAITQRLRAGADQWHRICAFSDEQLAKLISDTGIDILVDLSSHTSPNRLLAFARKPAPVQIAYGSYPATTGLSAMDYRITDAYLDSPGQTERFNVEKLLHLQGCYWCITTDDFNLEVNELPALSNGFVTFGSLNSAAKHSPKAIELWSRVLHAAPNFRLMLLVAEKSGHSPYLVEQFSSHGIDASRLMMVSRRPRPEYLQLYHQIDIGVDPFPYTGHTTSCDSFYMGVPVITLPGQSSVSRGGVSLLQNLNLPELIAISPEDYIKIATDLADYLPRLAAIRKSLRGRMSSSPICDGPAQARDIERLYRQAWHNRCSGGGGS